jgi:hypothetical protein
MKKAIIVAIAIFSFLYLSIAFVTMEFNPKLWLQDVRFFLVLWATFFTFFILSYPGFNKK